MYRSKLGRLGVGRIALVAGACALGVAGCGGSSSSSTTSRSTPTHSAAAAKFRPLLLGLDVASDAYVSAVYGGQPSLTEERSAIAKERDAVYTTDLAVRKLTVPQAAQAAFVAYLTQSGHVVAALDQLSKQPTMRAIHSHLSAVSPVYSTFFTAETKLRASVGLPKDDPWLRAQQPGPTVYRNSLSAPHGQIKWETASNVRYADGGLELAAAANHNATTGPQTPYTFDGRHVTAQVDAKALTGNPYIGIACPRATNVADSHLIGQIGPGATWSIGVFRLQQNGYLMRSLTPTKAVKVGQTNRIRVDCDEWHPGLTTVRLYVNGQFLGAASGAYELAATQEAGLAIISPKTPAVVKFTNWQVSKLGS